MITSRITSNESSRQVAADIRRQQAAIAEAREQLSSGKRVNRPSDDPAHAARLVDMAAASKQIEQYGRNADAAESRLALEESALRRVNDTLSRVRELALSAGSGKSDGDRAIIADEIGGRLAELYDAGNARDAAGEYLFAGSRADTRPFERGEPVAFKGNEIGRELRIGGSRTVATGNSGVEAFLRVPTGNGRFATDIDAANTGAATISSGSVTDRAAFRNVDYRIEFTSATSFEVKDAGGTTVLAAQPFASGEPITFEGITVSVDGEAASGDVFHIRSGERRDVFSTVARLEKLLLESPATAADRARLEQGIGSALEDLDNAMDGVNAARGGVGTKLQIIDTSRDENEGIALQLARTRSDIEDVDVAEAVTRLENHAFALETVQKSWARVQNLSLFNYL